MKFLLSVLLFASISTANAANLNGIPKTTAQLMKAAFAITYELSDEGDFDRAAALKILKGGD